MLESDLKLDLNLNLGSSSYSALVYSSVSSSSSSSSLHRCQPLRRWSSTAPTWYLLWTPPSSPQAPCTTAMSYLPYFWMCCLHCRSPPNWIRKKSWRRKFPHPLLTYTLLMWLESFPTSRLYFTEKFRILRYFPVLPSGTTFPYATKKWKSNEKECQRNVSPPALYLIYIRISYVDLS